MFHHGLMRQRHIVTFEHTCLWVNSCRGFISISLWCFCQGIQQQLSHAESPPSQLLKSFTPSRIELHWWSSSLILQANILKKASTYRQAWIFWLIYLFLLNWHDLFLLGCVGALTFPQAPTDSRQLLWTCREQTTGKQMKTPVNLTS